MTAAAAGLVHAVGLSAVVRHENITERNNVVDVAVADPVAHLHVAVSGQLDIASTHIENEIFNLLAMVACVQNRRLELVEDHDGAERARKAGRVLAPVLV